MDVASSGDRLLEVTQKPFLGPGRLSLCSTGIERDRRCFQDEHVVRLLSQHPLSAFQAFSGVAKGGGSSSLRPKLGIMVSL